MNLGNMKIGYRLALGFGLILIFSGIVGIVANNSINKMWQNSEMMHDHPFVVSKSVRDIRTNIVAMHRSMKDVALALNDLQINEAGVKVNEYERHVYQSFEIVFDRFLGDMNDVQIAYDAFVNWKPIRDEVIQLWYQGKLEEAAAITTGKGADHVDDLNLKIQKMVDFANEKGEILYREAKILKDSTTRKAYQLFLAIVIIGLIIAFYITYSITKPLSKMLVISDRLAKGDLSARNSNITKEETGKLAQSINDLATSIDSRNITQKGVANISEKMIVQSSMQEFGSELLEQLMETTAATMSVFYILNEATMEYEHFASIGANKKLLRSFNAENSEGEIGNAIAKKSIYYLRDIPENTIFKYNTIAVEVVPKEIITLPILVENTVVAVISLVNIHSFSKECYSILEQSWAGINISYSNLMAGERTQIFAEQLSRSNQQLEAQTEEMQDQAEEMQEQAEELQRTSNELQEQNIELDAQRKQVETANQMKSEFLSNMSHELRTPLNSIMALSRVLIMQANNRLTHEENNYLEIVERNGKRLLSLINDILDLSKIEAGRMEVLPASISLVTLLQMIKDNLQSLSEKRGLILTLDFPADMPKIETDESKLYQILTNIVGNAIKFTEKGKVDILVKHNSENVFIEVKDTGIGISEKMLPHIFDEFKQADGSTSRQFEGTGLGLAIANKIIKILGGDITVKSKLGKGSVFTIVLPIKWHKDFVQGETHNIEKKLLKATKETALAVDTKVEGKTSKSRILIVEDNPDAIIQLRTVLENKGYIIDVANGGKKALDYIKETIPDGIILDLMMPDIDGFEVLDKLRNTEKTKNIPVLILTAKDLTHEDLSRLNANNIQQLIHKGDVDIEGLLLKIKLMLGDDEEVSGSGFRFSGLEEKEDKPPRQSSPKKKGAKQNILIVEDNVDNMITIKAITKDKYNITEAVDGKKGLKMAQSQIPDLILLDMALPKMDGSEIVKTLKGNSETKNIIVIAVTAQAMKGDKEKFLRAGCDGYVSKPIDPEELLMKIEELLNG
jgi:signal transduction histidine kinase/DNA-binding response OmpR family regulator/HAMP domain-containing protein